MNNSVVPIHQHPTWNNDRKIVLPDAAHTLILPFNNAPEDEITNYLKTINMYADARGLWIGYPNLKRSVDSLLQWVGVDWPSLAAPTRPAIFDAVVHAITLVKEGLVRGETDRKYVIANFHCGLTSIAKDIAGYSAWGCLNQKAVEQWSPFTEPFQTWCESGKFEKVIFSRVEKCNEIDYDGLVWKIRSTIAPLRDVGIIHRYGVRN